ncbi:MAG: flippase-like domain-containing protein [Flavobacteriaceae bacterium]|nr:flippase-like domain-containing protein [Flavobacteriaceae bacterium]
MTKYIKTLIPLIIGLFLILLSYNSLENDDFKTIKKSFSMVEYKWIAASMFVGLLSHILRAYRWIFLARAINKKPKLHNSVFYVFLGYLVNLGIPRAGEISRATAISKYENIPFNKSIGTIIIERAIDMLILMLFCIIAVFSQYQWLKENAFDKIPTLTLLLVLLILISLSVIFYFIIIRSKNTIALKIKNILKGIISGVMSVKDVKNKISFSVYSILIWLMYILTMYLAMKSLPETSELSFAPIILCFIAGTFSFAFTNAGVGSYPIAIQQALILYTVPSAIGLSIGWIMWVSQTLLIITMGLLSFALLPLIKRKA